MGIPVLVGSTIASAQIDAASFVWSTWQTAGPNFSAERWNLNIDMGATTSTLFMDIAYSTSGTVFATSALNLNASITVGALYGISVDAAQGWYYNFHFGATSTIKAFYVVASRNDAALA